MLLPRAHPCTWCLCLKLSNFNYFFGLFRACGDTLNQRLFQTFQFVLVIFFFALTSDTFFLDQNYRANISFSRYPQAMQVRCRVCAFCCLPGARANRHMARMIIHQWLGGCQAQASDICMCGPQLVTVALGRRGGHCPK